LTEATWTWFRVAENEVIILVLLVSCLSNRPLPGGKPIRYYKWYL
jgi:hypothetical protein